MPVNGRITLEITSADVPWTIRQFTDTGISLHNVQILDNFTVIISINRSDLPRLTHLTEKYGGKVRILGRNGLIWTLESVFHRGILVIGVVILLFGVWLLPGRVLILEVEGNRNIPSRQILEAAGECGIRFGVSSRAVRSERMKNALLSSLPQLQWAGINTYGCRAVITVRERMQEDIQDKAGDVSSIVAVRDGVVLSCTVTRGNGLVTPGQAVQAGQVLISGYTDYGLCIRASEAEGEILAQTKRSLSVRTPSDMLLRTETGSRRAKYSLIIGKKRINFYKGSGISDSSCVKMYSEYVLTLPGGFKLPLTLRKEVETDAVLVEDIRAEDTARDELIHFAQDYLRQQMVGGSVTGKTEAFRSGDAYVLEGQYQCQEMIGRVRPERIGEYHEAD